MKLRTLVASGVLVFGIAGPASAAMAQTANDPYTTAPPPTVEGVQLERKPEVLPSVVVRAETLPVTGTDLVGLTAIGLLAIGAGTVLVRRSRLQPVAITAEA
jgi:LPXTG-motif cell wall-anchored protein